MRSGRSRFACGGLSESTGRLLLQLEQRHQRALKKVLNRVPPRAAFLKRAMSSPVPPFSVSPARNSAKSVLSADRPISIRSFPLSPLIVTAFRIGSSGHYCPARYRPRRSLLRGSGDCAPERGSVDSNIVILTACVDDQIPMTVRRSNSTMSSPAPVLIVTVP